MLATVSNLCSRRLLTRSRLGLDSSFLKGLAELCGGLGVPLLDLHGGGHLLVDQDPDDREQDDPRSNPHPRFGGAGDLVLEIGNGGVDLLDDLHR